MNLCKTPESGEDFQAYYQLRWQILRKPWEQPLGSEQDQLEQQAIHKMCVDENNKVLAVGRWQKTSQTRAEIRFMAVAEGQQGQGLGLQIMTALEDEAGKLGVTEIALNARENAIAFYARQGYQNLGFSHLLYQEIKHDKMLKTLPPLACHLSALAELLQDTWHQTIPMSQAMNIKVCFYDKQTLITSCDPAFNQNLHHTMFAGSIYTLATLTGWGWVYMQLQHHQLDGDIVLADGNIRYLSPIEGPAFAQTRQGQISGDLSRLIKGKRSRFSIEVSVACGDKVSAVFNGTYVVLPKVKTAKEGK